MDDVAAVADEQDQVAEADGPVELLREVGAQDLSVFFGRESLVQRVVEEVEGRPLAVVNEFTKNGNSPNAPFMLAFYDDVRAAYARQGIEEVLYRRLAVAGVTQPYSIVRSHGK